MFLNAFRGSTVIRPPVWLMRQAGRSLPEYRKLKEKHTFLELV
ncbi:MAG TPA: uroporphyrinogen decarboxylase family protein, partial [Verrucomicrobiota bacterium]|nr:uroporphyrinogen decarboxylase family protein [Verrucomicrobiota bacterium]